MTNNNEFINYTFATLKILQKKIPCLSGGIGKHRQIFFYNLRQQTDEKRKIIIALKQH